MLYIYDRRLLHSRSIKTIFRMKVHNNERQVWAMFHCAQVSMTSALFNVCTSFLQQMVTIEQWLYINTSDRSLPL